MLGRAPAAESAAAAVASTLCPAHLKTWKHRKLDQCSYGLTSVGSMHWNSGMQGAVYGHLFRELLITLLPVIHLIFYAYLENRLGDTPGEVTGELSLQVWGGIL